MGNHSSRSLGTIVGTTDTQLLSGKTLDFGTLIHTLVSTSNNHATGGSLQFGPGDYINYGCPTCSPSPITGSTDQTLIRAQGLFPISVGDYLGISTYPITIHGLTSGSCVVSASATGGTLNLCANASVDASGNFVGKSFTGIGALLLQSGQPGSNFTPQANLSQLAIQNDWNLYFSAQDGTFGQVPFLGGQVAANQTAFGSGPGTFATVTLPNCPDTGGNHWNYNNSTQTVSCGTSGSGSGVTGSAPVSVTAGVVSASIPTSISGTTVVPDLGIVSSVSPTYDFVADAGCDPSGTTAADTCIANVIGYFSGKNGGTLTGCGLFKLNMTSNPGILVNAPISINQAAVTQVA